MIAIQHPLPAQIPGTQHSVTSWHFGCAGTGPKVYLQAGLHADEWPPMLVAHHLKLQLSALELAGAITGEITLVPMVNPIGLAQQFQGQPLGRFDLADGRNFNRGYPYLSAQVRNRIAAALHDDAGANVRMIRSALRDALRDMPPQTESAALKYWAMEQAIDADIVLDLHCDTEAVLHVYTGTPHASRGLRLARVLHADALIVSRESGDHPFDEALARVWWEMADEFEGRFPVPLSCFSATVELRGQQDMTHAMAQRDAQRLIQFLSLEGVIQMAPFELADARCRATPLEAVEPLIATQSGLVLHLKQVGDHVLAGEPIIELLNPLTDETQTLCATFGGRLFARTTNRFVSAGARLAKIAGVTPFRSGNLLSE